MNESVQRFYDAYIQHFNSKPNTILEIGSRDGNDAEIWRKMADIDVRNVFIVEAHPELAREITRKYDFRVFPFALGAEPGIYEFNAIPLTFDPSLVGTSSLLTKDEEYLKKAGGDPKIHNPERWIKTLLVKGETLLWLIDRPEIDLVKIDVEGTTFQVLKGFGDGIRALKLLHLEVEFIPIWHNQTTFEQIKPYLQYYGFEELYYEPRYYNGQQGDSIWVRKG